MSTFHLNKIKDELEMEIEKNFELIQTINQLPQLLKIDQVYLIYELSFLKIFLAWEYFLEKAFIFYMLGEKTDSGYQPQSRIRILEADEKLAYEIVKGERRFPDWLNLEFMREKSELFFKDGAPFKDTLYNNQTIKSGLQMMKTTRNRIVHASPKTKEEFNSMLRNEFGYVLDITPGKFLMMEEKETKKFYIDYFKEILLTAANQIVR
jgi:hypothetical protein